MHIQKQVKLFCAIRHPNSDYYWREGVATGSGHNGGCWLLLSILLVDLGADYTVVFTL